MGRCTGGDNLRLSSASRQYEYQNETDGTDQMTMIDDCVQSLQKTDGSDTDHKKVWEMFSIAKSEPGAMAKPLTAIAII